MFIKLLATNVFVAINLSINGCLCLNVAYGGNASQSSTVLGAVAERAVDGITDRDFQNNVCTHTVAGDDAWLSVDIGRVKLIEAVVIFNRGDDCGERLINFTADIAVEDRSDGFTLCSYHPDPALTGQKVLMKCLRPTPGRFVRIMIHRTTYSKMICGSSMVSLTLCELEVFTAGVSRNNRTFTKVEGVRATGTVISQRNVSSRTQCLCQCYNNAQCTSCNLQRHGNRIFCEQLDELDLSNMGNSGKPINAPGWRHYY